MTRRAQLVDGKIEYEPFPDFKLCEVCATNRTTDQYEEICGVCEHNKAIYDELILCVDEVRKEAEDLGCQLTTIVSQTDGLNRELSTKLQVRTHERNVAEKKLARFKYIIEFAQWSMNEM